MMSRAKRAMYPAVAGVGGGALAGIVDTALPNRPVLAGVAKFITAIIGGTVLKRRTEMAYGFIGGAMGGIGYGIGVKMGGGLVALSKGQALKGIADLAAEDDELAAILADSEDLQDLVDGGDLADGLADDDDVSDLVDE